METRLAEITGIVVIITALTSMLHYVDNKYMDTTEFLEIFGMLATTMYDRRISDLTQDLYYEQSAELENDERIKFLKSRIVYVKKNRQIFLDTGHLPIGDAININRKALKKVLLN